MDSIELSSVSSVERVKVNSEEECCIFPTTTIMAIVMMYSEWETSDKVQRFLREIPLSTNYLIQTCRDWRLREQKTVHKILDFQRISSIALDQHIRLPNLNDQCQLGLSRDQARALRDIDCTNIHDWSKLFPESRI